MCRTLATPCNSCTARHAMVAASGAVAHPACFDLPSHAAYTPDLRHERQLTGRCTAVPRRLRGLSRSNRHRRRPGAHGTGTRPLDGRHGADHGVRISVQLYLSLQVPSGILGERFGARMALGLALLGCSHSSLITGTVPAGGAAYCMSAGTLSSNSADVELALRCPYSVGIAEQPSAMRALAVMMPTFVCSAQPHSGSEESWFEPRRGNLESSTTIDGALAGAVFRFGVSWVHRGFVRQSFEPELATLDLLTPSGEQMLRRASYKGNKRPLSPCL